MAGEPLKLIVGLGNPGTEYARTRHNAGFQFVDELARRYGGELPQRATAPRRAGARASSALRDLWLLKPMSYMNHSGDAVQQRRHVLQDPACSRSWSPTTSWTFRPASCA